MGLARWQSSVSRLLLFLTACRERRLVPRGHLVLPGDAAAEHDRVMSSSHTRTHLGKTANCWYAANVNIF